MLMNVRLLIELSRGSFAMAVSTWTLEAWPWWQTMHRLLASARGFPTPEGKTTLSRAAPAAGRAYRVVPSPSLLWQAAQEILLPSLAEVLTTPSFTKSM